MCLLGGLGAAIQLGSNKISRQGNSDVITTFINLPAVLISLYKTLFAGAGVLYGFNRMF